MAGDWANRYVGIPFADGGRDPARGLDCWGLLVAIFARECGIALPAYDDAPARNGVEAARLIAEGAGDWLQIADLAALRDGAGWGRARPFDGLLIHWGGFNSHVGLVVTGRRFIHAPVDQSVAIDRGDAAQWRHRIVGLYRHAAFDR